MMKMSFFFFLVIVFVFLILKVLLNRYSKLKLNLTNGRDVRIIKGGSGLSKNKLLEKIYAGMLASKLYKSVSLNKDEGIITAKTKTTMKSWGEIVVVNTADRIEGVDICVESSCVVKTTQFDWGKNNENISVLLKVIEKAKIEGVVE